MWDNVHRFLKREAFLTRDIMPASFGYFLLGGAILILLLVSLVIGGIVFAIIGIVKASKRKKARKMAEKEQAVIAEEVPTNE